MPSHQPQRLCDIDLEQHPSFTLFLPHLTLNLNQLPHSNHIDSSALACRQLRANNLLAESASLGAIAEVRYRILLYTITPSDNH